MKAWSETHGAVFELTRHFLSRTFDSELFTRPGQWKPVVTGCLAMLLTARVALMAMMSPHAALRATHAGQSAEMLAETAAMTLLMSICGLIAIVQWQMLLPGRSDYLALAGLPVHPRQIFLARFAAFAIFATAIVVALNALPAALSTAPLANAAAWSMACYFPMFAMIGLQGALLNLLPRKWFPRIAPLLLGVLSCGLLLGVLGSFHIGAWAADGEALLEKFAWAPQCGSPGSNRCCAEAIVQRASRWGSERWRRLGSPRLSRRPRTS